MRSINFDDGCQAFAINGDESRTIRFNPGDPNFFVRVRESMERIHDKQKYLEEIKINPDGTAMGGSEEAMQILKEFDDLLRKETNYIFNSDVYDTIFAGQSPLCIVGKNREFLFEAFYNTALPIVMNEIEAFGKSSESRIAKYIQAYKR